MLKSGLLRKRSLKISIFYIHIIIGKKKHTNVKMYNACIGRLADHWEKHDVVLIKESANFFFLCGGV